MQYLSYNWIFFAFAADQFMISLVNKFLVNKFLDNFKPLVYITDTAVETDRRRIILIY